MKKITAALLLIIVLFSCKNKEEKKETTQPAETVSNTLKLECTEEVMTKPTGEIINRRKDTSAGVEYITSIDFLKDSLVMYNYVPGIGNGTLSENNILTLAYSDIDPAGVEINDFDIDMTDGTKEHVYVFYTRSKGEKKVFRNITYTCLDPEVHFKDYPAHTITTSCTSKEVAKQIVEKIKAKLAAK